MRAAILDQRITSVSYGWDGARNASPSVQRVNGAVVRRSLANNPRFTRTSGTVEVRRNLASSPAGTSTYLNPRELGFIARWAGLGGSQEISLLNDIQGPSGTGITTAIRKTWTVIGTGLRDVGFAHAGDNGNAYPVAPGEVFTISSYWRVSRSQNTLISSRFNIYFYNSSGTSVSNIAGSNYTGHVVADEWNRVSMTFTVPEGVSFIKPYPLISFTDNTSLQVGDTLDATGLLVEKSAVLRPYFDGSYSPDPDLTPVWVGTANASQSYLRGFVPGNTGNNNNYVVASSYGARLIPNNTSNESPVTVGGSGSSTSGYGITFTPGKWYGVRAVCTLLAPQTGTLNGAARRMRLTSNNVAGWTGARHVYSAQPPNKAGSYQEEIVTQIPADSVWAILMLYNGATFGNGDVYWDKLLIVEGDTEEEVRRKLAQGYFDGDTQVNAETINNL